MQFHDHAARLSPPLFESVFAQSPPPIPPRPSSSILHKPLQHLIPRNDSPQPFPENPQRNRQRTDCYKAAPQDIENFQYAISVQPVVNEVSQAKCEEIARVDCNERYIMVSEEGRKGKWSQYLLRKDPRRNRSHSQTRIPLQMPDSYLQTRMSGRARSSVYLSVSKYSPIK